MSLETGRTAKEQAEHEFMVIKDLEDADFATNKWRDKTAPGVYRTRFIDAMLRVQSGDVQTIKMSRSTNPAGHEMIYLHLPVRVPALRNYERAIWARVDNLELDEPNVRDLLPQEGA